MSVLPQNNSDSYNVSIHRGRFKDEDCTSDPEESVAPLLTEA